MTLPCFPELPGPRRDVNVLGSFSLCETEQVSHLFNGFGLGAVQHCCEASFRLGTLLTCRPSAL